MLPATHRLVDADAFRATTRRGRRAGSTTLVTHLLVDDTVGEHSGARPARAGFVVSRAVGISVVRSRVKRRLRHLVAERLDRLPAGGDLVVRANPPAAQATYAELGSDLDRCLDRILIAEPGARTP
ncbi:ribonuclease P protein component [Nocardioides ultimimeridianus]